MSRKSKNVVVREIDLKIKELKPEEPEEIEEVEEDDEEEGLEDFVENLWEEKLHDEEKEKEDSFIPSGLILSSGQVQENFTARLEETVFEEGSSSGGGSDNPSGDFYNSSGGGMGSGYAEGGMGNGYGAGEDSNEAMYGGRSGNDSAYNPSNSRDDSSGKMYGGNVGRQSSEKSDRAQTGSLYRAKH